jgi:signal transduction histidine kinase
MFYIGSVLLSLAVVQAVMAAVLFTFWRTRLGARGLPEMTLAMTVSSLGAVLTGVGAATANFYLGFIGMQGFVIGVVAVTRSMRRLQGLQPLYPLEAAIIVTCAVGDAYFILATQEISGALVTNSLAYAVICTVTAVHLFREQRGELIPGCRVLASIFSAFAALSLLRAVIRIAYDIPTPTNMQAVSFDLIFTLIAIAVSIGWSLGFLWTSYSVAEYRLRAANDKLNRFSGAVAHDLNTPLNAVIGYLDAIETLPQSAQHRKAEFIESARQAAMRMSKFIHMLLEQSRTLSGDAEPVAVDINHCIDEALEALRAKFDGVQADIQQDVAHRTLANPFQMTRVFQNLLDNAMKYRDPDRPLNIRISSRQSGDWVEVIVQDNGRGISANSQNKIFRQFQRADNIGTIPGYGLGLSECRSIVTAFGGTIDVQSEPGNGAAFILRLPAASP